MSAEVERWLEEAKVRTATRLATKQLLERHADELADLIHREMCLASLDWD